MKRLLAALAVLLIAANAPIDKPRPVSELPYWETSVFIAAPGWEERGEEFAKWLAPSVRVTKGGGGSGTICYYDDSENWAYVISCGHLFSNGYKSHESYKKSPNTMKVEVFYHNEKRLEKPDVYEAEVLCHVNNLNSGVYDVSLLRFQPRWSNPWVCPIAPLDYKLEKGRQYHSCGCDGLTEAAHYLVRYERENKTSDGFSEIITSENNPRGGRSGGGVMTDDGLLVFICSRGNRSNAFWTSLQQIHTFLKKEGFENVLEGKTMANKIPIIDRNNPQGKYPNNYIPSPSK